MRLLVPTLPRLSDTKCCTSLHHSHPCSYFPASRSPGSMPRIVARRGVGYACCRFLHAFFRRRLICRCCAQSYNSLGQNACTVAAYLMSTCNGGCELSYSLLCPCIFDLVVSSFSQHSPSKSWPRDTTTRGQAVMMTAICASATASHIPSLVRVSHAKEKNGFRTDSLRCPFRITWAYCMYLTLDGRNICRTAQRFYLPRREFPVAVDNLMRLT
jgi:hypothetical protein